jgi:hypothetical protein
MALHLDPFQPEPLRGTEKVRAADVGTERRIVRDGIERIGHGALVCPRCDFPLVVADPVPAGNWVTCGYCDHAAPARDFLVRDVYDTVANEVYLIARIA